MIANKYLKDSSELINLARIKEVGPGKAIFKVIQGKYDEISKSVDENPERNDTHLKKDIVYKLGQLNILKQLLNLPEKTDKFIQAQPGE